MPESKFGQITERVLKSTFYHLKQTEQTLEVIKGIVREEIPESFEERFVLDPNELDNETRFGVKKRKRLI